MPTTSLPQGNDPAYTRKLTPGHTLTLTWWDIWYLVVLLNDHAGDWEALAARLRQTWSPLRFGREKLEGLLHHLRHLRQQLTDAGLSPEAALKPQGPALLKSQRSRARNMLFKNQPSHYDWSEWMWRTPRYERETRALRGYWPQFPVSPAPYAEAFGKLYKTTGSYSENQSFGLERKLSAFLDRKEKRATLVELLALYRATLTVMLEKFDIVDDSYGVIGQLYHDVFTGYWQLDRAACHLPAELFLQDLIELLLWEDYGFTYAGLPKFYASLAPDEAALAEILLRTQWAELQAVELEYQAEEALTHLGLLCAQQQQFDKFVELARQMGCREWQRITTLAEMAQKRRRPTLALQVYQAALAQPGGHTNNLQKEYEALQAKLAKRKTARRRP